MLLREAIADRLAVQGVPDQDKGEGGDDDCRGPGDDVEQRELVYLPISSCLLISCSMKTRTSGSRTPFRTCERMLNLTSGKFGIRTTRGAGEEQQGVEPVEERASLKLLSRPLSNPRPSQTV